MTTQVRSNLETGAQRVRERLQSLHPDLELDCWSWSWIAEPKMLLSSLHSSVKQILSYKLEKVLVLSLTALMLAILPLFLFLILCMFAIRHAVSILAKHLRPDLGSIIPTRSAGFATDLVYNKVSKYSVVVPLYLDGHLGVGDLRARLSEVLDKKDVIKEPRAGTSSNPEDLDTISVLRYPQLKQYAYSWFGILFWKWERNFKIEDHVNLLNDKRYVRNSGTTLNEEDLARIGQDFASKPFRKGHSPWEMLLVHHTCKDKGEPRTLVIFRIHHALGDGFSILKFCLEDLSSQESGLRLQETKTRFPKSIPWPPEHESAEGFIRAVQRELTGEKLYKMANFTVTATYDLISAVISSWDFNAWKLSERKLRHRIKIGVTKPIPLADLKRIKNQNEAALTSLLLAAYAGALRNFMLERNRNRHAQIPIPDDVHCMITLPFPGHPDRLTNHMTGTYAKLPLGLQSPKARLLAIDHQLEVTKRSTIPTLMFYAFQLSGLAPGPITWLYFENFIHTCTLSNFPGPEQPVNFLGHEVLDGSFAAGVGNIPFVFTALSYNGNIRLAFAMDEAFTTGGNDGELGSKIMEELQLLDKNLESSGQ